MSNTKTCHRCRRTLPLDAFGMRKDSSDGNEYQCRDCIKKYNADYYRRSKARKQRKRDARPEHGASKVAALSAFFESLDPGKPHTATWWRQAARDGGFAWAGYGDVRAALSMAGIEPFDLRRGNLYAVGSVKGDSRARKAGRRKSTRTKAERHRRTDESAPQVHQERKEGVQ